MNTYPASLVTRQTNFNAQIFRCEMGNAEKVLRSQILISRQSGNIHVDQLAFGVQDMQGRRVLNLWDGTEGVIKNCDSFGRVWIKIGLVTWPIEGLELRQFKVLSEPERLTKPRTRRGTTTATRLKKALSSE